MTQEELTPDVVWFEGNTKSVSNRLDDSLSSSLDDVDGPDALQHKSQYVTPKMKCVIINISLIFN